MKIDLHIHTSKYSPCSTMTPHELMAAARDQGLDGICLTEHNRVWAKSDAAQLSDEYGLAVFRGMEITTTGGDILVIGLEEEPPGLLTPAELKVKIDSCGGIAIAAHPFRGFLLFGFGDLEMSIKDAVENPTFSQVHGLEVCNSMVTDQENDFARRVAEDLGLLMVGGSDAHSPKAVGTCVTVLDDVVRNEAELVESLLSNRFTLMKMK